MPITFEELFQLGVDHPEEPLYPCALFDEKVHLVENRNRARVETYCRQLGPAKLHALVFKLPKESVECPKCVRLAGLS